MDKAIRWRWGLGCAMIQPVQSGKREKTQSIHWVNVRIFFDAVLTETNLKMWQVRSSEFSKPIETILVDVLMGAGLPPLRL